MLISVHYLRHFVVQHPHARFHSLHFVSTTIDDVLDCFHLSLSVRSSLNSPLNSSTRSRPFVARQLLEFLSCEKMATRRFVDRAVRLRIVQLGIFTTHQRFFIRVTRSFRPSAFYGLALANRRKRHRKLTIERYTSSRKPASNPRRMLPIIYHLDYPGNRYLQ